MNNFLWHKDVKQKFSKNYSFCLLRFKGCVTVKAITFFFCTPIVQMRSNRASVQRSVSDDFQNSIQSGNSSGEDPFSAYQLTEEDQEYAVELRRELKFFFMNPIEKYQARGRKPYKFGVQLFKILVITIQVFKMNITWT